MNSPILELVYQVIDEMNEQFAGEKIIEKSENTLLYGKNSSLDSLELINFIVLTEQRFEEEYNVHLVLADERALQMRNNPFENIRSFVDYIEMLCDEKKISYFK